WLGGMLTNFQTILGRVKKMQEYERMLTAGDFENMPKKEALILRRELVKLQRNLGGIRGLSRLPDAIFVIDTKKEHLAVTEANKLKLPVVAVVDTNCDPDLIQYVIPGNDDAIRAGNLLCRVIAEAVDEGRFIASRKARIAADAAGPAVVERSEEEEAQRAQQQAEARRQAALQAQEREARLAAQTGAPTEAEAPTAETPAAENPSAETPATEAAPAASDAADPAAPSA
ncbi:MAG: 30S ribosomal protein S2, partial [Acidimicrobiales bacterium]|nr:30S ribosomal protein S2 [Acidimicrobiales bacterium]